MNSPAPPSSGYRGDDRPRYEDYSRCIHCGLCLNHCPTHRLLGVEMDSPRGRIHQMIRSESTRLNSSHIQKSRMPSSA